MSTLEYDSDDESDEEYDEDFLTQEELLNYSEEIITSHDNSESPFQLHKWFIVLENEDINGQIACKLVLPNFRILGIELSIEICEFLLEELNKLLKSDRYVHITAVRAISNSMFILQNFLDRELKM